MVERDGLENRCIYYRYPGFESLTLRQLHIGVLMIHKEYLLADADVPLISRDELRDELIIYNIDNSTTNQLITQFEQLTGKTIDRSYKVNELSGGQKVILMVLLVIYSPAPKIRFKNLMQSLDSKRREAIQNLINSCGKDIILEEDND